MENDENQTSQRDASPTAHCSPSFERGCRDKMRISINENPPMKARSLAQKHGRDYGVYHCPHCNYFHLTSKLEKSNRYKDLEYRTTVFS